MSRSRQGTRLMRYSDSPERKYRRVTRISLACCSAGGSPPDSPCSSVGAKASSASSLDSSKDTSAMPRGPVSALPLQMTSSMASPRRCLALCSPMTQRIASTMFDFPQPFGPTIPVMPSGSSRTVRSMNDLNPLSSSRLIRITFLHPAPDGERSSIVEQLRVPVRRVDRVQEGNPLLVTPEIEGLGDERRPLRTERASDEPHTRFERRSAPLGPVAAQARTHDVLPHRFTTAGSRHHMVEIAPRTWEHDPAVLTPVRVPRKDVEPAESDVSFRDAVISEEQNDLRQPDGAMDQADGLLLRGEIGPAGEIERAILPVHGPGDVLIQQGQRTPDRRDVHRQKRPIEDQDLRIEDRHRARRRNASWMNRRGQFFPRGASAGGRHRSTGRRAARVSSRRPTRVVCGAWRTRSGSVRASVAIARMAAMNSSRVSRDSVSVGSIMSAPFTTSGK